jgi:transposase
LLARIAGDQTLPAVARDLFAAPSDNLAEVQARFKVVDAKLLAWHRAHPASVALAEIPGVGPIGASLMVMKTPDPRAFRSGRPFAAWLGMTPKDLSTAGKVRLGVITRANKIARIAWTMMSTAEVFDARRLTLAMATGAA